MDDIRPPRNYNTTPTNNYGGAPGQQPEGQSPYEIPQPNQGYAAPPAHDPSYVLPAHHGAGKGTKVALVLFVLLFVAVSGFAVWQYMQMQDLKADVAELEKENDRLNQRVYSLNYDNRDLAQQLELVKAENESLKEESEQMQQECGALCDNITP